MISLSRYRDKVLKIMLTKKEKDELMEKVRLSGMGSISKFIRTAISVNPIVKIDTSGLNEFAYQLEKIGININQIAKVANQTGNIYENEIKDIQEKINGIYKIIDEVYSLIENVKGRDV